MRLADVPDSQHFQEWADLANPVLYPGADTLTTLDPRTLAHIVEREAIPLPTRLVAGAILSLTGDPRLTLSPATCVVPGGTVSVGLPDQHVAAVVARWSRVGVVEDWISKEVPRHDVFVKDFWICTYPVTNSEYRQFLVDTRRRTRPSTWYLGAYPWDRSNHPVAGISPTDADAYAAWLTTRTGHPWRLPTEVEWEYAAAGPDGLEFPWGDRFDPSKANTREAGVHTTTPVGVFPGGRSTFGVLDLAGNVEEYVSDEYAPYPGGRRIVDHLVEAMSTYRITRGGSFSRFGDLARTRRRHGAFPGPLYPVGFRLASGVQP